MANNTLERVQLTDRRAVNRIASGAGGWFICIITALAILTPLFWTFRDSLSNGAAGVRRAMASDEWTKILSNTVVLAIESVVVAMVLGTATAWSAHRLKPGRRWMSIIPIAPIFVPGVALATGWAFLLSPQVGYLNKVIRDVLPIFGNSGPFNVYSIPWIAALTGISASGFVYLFVRSALSQLNQDVLDAAAVSGLSQGRVFFKIVVPLIRPSLTYGAATTLLLGVGQVTMPLFLGQQAGIDVLSTAMYRHMSTSPVDFGAAAAYGLPIVLLGVLLLGLQRITIGDKARFVTSGGRANRPLARTGRGGELLLVGFGLVTAVLPLLALIYVSFSRFWSADFSFSRLTSANYRAVFHDPENYDAIKNTLTFTAITIVISLALAYVCARAIYNSQNRRLLSTVQDTIVSLPLGIPGVIFGLGFLLAYSNTPLLNFHIYGTPASMIIVYVVLVLPFTVRMLLSAMAHIGTELSDAAATCGAGWARRILFIDIPMLRSTLGFAGGLVVALVAQEFSASIMVRTGNTQVASTALYDAWAFSSYPVTAALAVVICLITAAGVVLCFALGGRSMLEESGHA